ncbi:MAG: TlpA family protein disulfide reductase [Muribaculum sp.]|nr:TlpA family protein disulfide reductase [Muribaculum sp.]
MKYHIFTAAAVLIISWLSVSASQDTTMICNGNVCLLVDNNTTDDNIPTFEQIMSRAVAHEQHVHDSISSMAERHMSQMANCTTKQQRDSIVSIYFNDIQPELLNSIYNLEISKMRQLSKMDICDEWIDLFCDLSRQAYYNNDERATLYEGLKSIYSNLTATDTVHPKIIEAHTYLYPPIQLQPGDYMADGDLIDCNGNHHTLSDYLGKYILIDFWESTCGACRMSVPELRQLSETMSDRLNVIGINTESISEWKKVSETSSYPGINLHQADYTNRSPLGIPMKYRVNGYPTFVLIDPTGKIVRTQFGYREGLLHSLTETVLPVNPD